MRCARLRVYLGASAAAAHRAALVLRVSFLAWLIGIACAGSVPVSRHSLLLHCITVFLTSFTRGIVRAPRLRVYAATRARCAACCTRTHELSDRRCDFFFIAPWFSAPARFACAFVLVARAGLPAAPLRCCAALSDRRARYGGQRCLSIAYRAFTRRDGAVCTHGAALHYKSAHLR